MGRPATKAELIQAAAEKYEELNKMISSLSEGELDTPFDFTKMKSRTQAHWGRDRNLRDILVHLYEWHRLLLDWVAANRKGENRSFLPEPYNWKTYGDMNMEIWRKHQNTTLDQAKAMLEQSHRESMALAETFSDQELFDRGVYPWVGGSTLGSYFVSNMSSHYDWAIKKLKAHRKNCRQTE